MDMSGVDVVYHAFEGLAKAYGDHLKPTQSMGKLIENDHLGQKSGKGFYNYRK